MNYTLPLPRCLSRTFSLSVCRDFLQLPPVDKSGRETKFCFEVPAWDRCIQRTILLKKVFRQREEKFIGILNRVRIGDLCKKDKAELLKCHYNFRTLPEDGIQATKLYPHRISCERVNVEAVGFPIFICRFISI